MAPAPADARSLSAGPGFGGCASAGTCNRLLGSMADDPSRFDEGYVAASIKIPMLPIYGSLKLVE
jgi:hypothetical protein